MHLCQIISTPFFPSFSFGAFPVVLQAIYISALLLLHYHLLPSNTSSCLFVTKQVRDKYIAVGGLDGWITLLEAVEHGKSKGHELARILRPAPKKPKVAAKAGKKKTSAPGSAGRGEVAEALKGGGAKMAVDAGGAKGDWKNVGIAVAVALLAIFIAKVAAGFVFEQ